MRLAELLNYASRVRCRMTIVDTGIDGLRRLGVEFESNCIVGKTLSYDDLHAWASKASSWHREPDCQGL